MAETKRMFIDGEWVDAEGGDSFETLDPATNKPIARVPAGTEDDVDRAVEAARRAFEDEWRRADPAKRAKVLRRAAQLVHERLDEIVETEVRDNGKPYREAKADVRYAAQTFDYYAGAVDKLEGSTIPVPGNRLNYTLVEPLGVTAHIVPWNYPFQLASRSIAPALAAGNTVVAKPASTTPLSLLLMADILKDAGAPDGAFNVVTGSGRVVGGGLAEHPGVDAITLTGSYETGVSVMEAAARNVTPVTLELGGKGPNIVLPDADLDRAMKGVAYGIFLNAGQMCWAGSRLLVHEDHATDFVAKLAAFAEKWTLGPGLDKDTRMGPLNSREHLERVMSYVEQGKKEGATVATGGERPSDERLAAGNFLQPTIFTDVDPDMTIAQEEIFGPVLSVLTYSSDDEALEIANGVETGLFSGVWTTNLQRAHRFAAELDYGMVSVNEYPVTFPNTPFSGFKQSGIGSEQGIEGLRHYTRTKNVNVNLG